MIGQCQVRIDDYPIPIDACAGTIRGETTDYLYYSEQGENWITWVFDDGNGNVSTQYQKVIIKDVTPPVLSLKPIGVRLDDTGNARISIEDINNGTEDNCSSFEDLVFEIF